MVMVTLVIRMATITMMTTILMLTMIFIIKFRILMVVGAGRGPLVRASFAASQACSRPIKVYAVEKNPNAVVTYVSFFCALLKFSKKKIE